MNQYGNDPVSIPGITGFRSRGAAIGTNVSVIVNDALFRANAIGVTGNNANIPISGYLSINVNTVNPTTLGTDFELQLTPKASGSSRKQAFFVSSEGILAVKESANCMAGLATTGAGGSVTVSNTQISGTSKVTLTVQDGGAAPTGVVFLASRIPGTSFTITSSTAQVGVQVYYQIWEPTIP